MTSVTSDAQWFDEERLLALQELAEATGWSEGEIVELVEYGALAPADPAVGDWRFGVRSITVARTAYRLHQEFELEPHGVAVLLAYLERIRDLERELCALRAQLSP
jgi:chaperone modulatory protein CbpM